MEEINIIAAKGIETANYFRLGYEGAANSSFVELIDAILLFCQHHKQVGEQINNILNVMIQAQERHDILFIADIIEYEITPYLLEISKTLK